MFGHIDAASHSNKDITFTSVVLCVGLILELFFDELSDMLEEDSFQEFFITETGHSSNESDNSLCFNDVFHVHGAQFGHQLGGESGELFLGLDQLSIAELGKLQEICAEDIETVADMTSNSVSLSDSSSGDFEDLFNVRDVFLGELAELGEDDPDLDISDFKSSFNFSELRGGLGIDVVIQLGNNGQEVVQEELDGINVKVLSQNRKKPRVGFAFVIRGIQISFHNLKRESLEDEFKVDFLDEFSNDGLPDVMGLLAFIFNPSEDKLVCGFRAGVVKLIKEGSQNVGDVLLGIIELRGKKISKGDDDSIKGVGALGFFSIDGQIIETQNSFQSVISTGREDPEGLVDSVGKDQFD